MKQENKTSLASALEAMDSGFHGPVVSKDPGVSYIVNPASCFSILAAAALLQGNYAGRGSTRGEHAGENAKPKNLNNDPNRAKGLKEFRFDRYGELDPHNPDPEHRVYAGTLKAARKKLRLIRMNA